MVIQTVYLPAENIRFIREWLQYHSEIGVEHFYLYDNTGSQFLDCGNSVALTGKNKHNRVIEQKDVVEEEAEILKDFSVTKVKWLPIENGKPTYGQMLACKHFAESYKSGLCAFIDMDEFIVPQEPFKESRLYQKRYNDRWNYERVADCTKTFEIDTRRWGSKCILEMSRFTPSDTIHFTDKVLDISRSWFNHYNHNETTHDWLLKNCSWIDPSWEPRSFADVYGRGDS
jgi:hypothetical protein